jgi:hypothetical protein
MKRISLLAAAVGLVAAGALYGADAPKTPRAEINFDHPDKFTDIKDEMYPTDQGQQAILDRIRDFLVVEAREYIPEGCKLTMAFTDIRLAGEFEPWRGPRWDQTRIVTPLYPPRFVFDWTVTDAAGKTIKQGQEDIRDVAFYLRVTLDPQDPLRYEKSILGDWMRGSLGNVKQLVASN